MEQSKNAYYKSPVAPMSSFFWMCCKERQKKGHLALNNQEHSLIDGDSYFSAIFILVVRPQIECGLKCPEFLAMIAKYGVKILKEVDNVAKKKSPFSIPHIVSKV